MKLVIIAMKNRKMLFNLIYSDFRNRYLGNHLGLVWAFIQPLVMVAVYWFVFTKGFRIGAVSGIPFLVWLLCGMVPWLLLSDAIISASGAIVSQSFIVKKMVFEVKLLPIIKIGSALLVNLAFWFFLISVCIIYGYYPNWWWLQLTYYMLCIIAISISLSLLFSGIMPFILDIGQLLSVLFQILMWLTPVLWDKSIIAQGYEPIIRLNPFAYIINGFRDTIFYQIPFWQDYKQLMYFWGFVIVIIWFGNRTFNKLRLHFADVL